MERRTPKQTIEEIINTHSYKGIKISKSVYRNDFYIIVSINDIPDIIYEYVRDNYNLTMLSSNRIEFYEYFPIECEIANEGRD